MKKSLIGLALAAGVGLVSGPASAVVISGIDFGALGGGGLHLETETLAEQFINPATTAPGTGTGMGYGFVTTVNGNTNYCTAGGGCGLYYTVNFTGGTFISPTEITFTGTDVNIYYLNGPTINLLNQTSPANLALITAGTLYVSLSGHGNLGGGLPANVVSDAKGTLSGAGLNLLGNGLLDVNIGPGNAAFANFLNGNGLVDAVGGHADLAYTESANNQVLNPSDVAAGLANNCQSATAAPTTGAWCWQGTLNTRGVANLPEPGTMALIGLALFGAGFVRRGRRA